MTQRTNYSLGLLVTILCTVFLVLALRSSKRLMSVTRQLEAQQEATSRVEKQLQSAILQESAAESRRRQLEDKMSELVAQQNSDRSFIAEMWPKLVRSVPAGPPADVEKKTAVKYDVEAIRKMSSAAKGDFFSLLRKIVTEEGLRSTLEQHADDPAYWVANASLLEDKKSALQQLERAATVHTNSPIVLAALVEARMANGRFDASTLIYVDQLKHADPENAWADYYAAYVQFRSGNAQDALRSLSDAGTKSRCSDNALETLMARYDFLLAEGCSESVALGLSAFTTSFPQLSMFNQMNEDVRGRVKALAAEGQFAEALQTAGDLMRVGSTISPSGRFIVYDRAGTKLFRSGLLAKKEVYEAMGDTSRSTEMDSQLQALAGRMAIIDTMVASFGTVFPKMNEHDIVAYIDDAMINGEFSALLHIPAIAASLGQSPAAVP